jgi:hypothetical protein
METYEKDILKREITAEVKEDLTRSAGKRITRRILLALAIILFELLLWALITTAVVKDTSIGDGLFACFWACYFRGAQAWFICMFKGE